MKNTKGTKSQKKAENSFLLVAVGAAAGGLDAMTDLLRQLPDATGLAYLYLQSENAVTDDVISSQLADATSMPVQQAKSQLKMQPDHVYVIPHSKLVSLAEGTFKVRSSRAKESMHMPIDRFFSHLADQYKEMVVGILLSGDNGDGSQGMYAIKMAGGLTLAQNESAAFQSMPRNGIAEGVVDLVLSPAEMAGELEKMGHQKDGYFSAIQDLDEEAINNKDEDLVNILQLLYKSTGLDFSQYKMSTIKRRIIRRMMLFRQETLNGYAQYIRNNKSEINLLYQDLLINVTTFFRDADMCEYLKKTLLPRILKAKSPNEPIRIWVPACSTGQETYSLAMLLMEVLGDRANTTPIQIFATDISETAISKARLGIYSKSDVHNISPRRLQRFFVKKDGTYRIVKNIRELCVFATHNIFKDPPFSRLDLASCCNLLIYLDNNLQKKIIATFYYSLNNNGYLVLGKSETVGSSSYLFLQQDKKLKVYLKKKDAPVKAMFEMNHRVGGGDKAETSAKRHAVEKPRADEADLERVADRLLLKRYTPASVIVNQDLDIVQFRGSTGQFLEPSPGKASLNLLKMARPGLGFELRNIVHKAKRSGEPEKRSGLELNLQGKIHRVSVEAIPLRPDGEEQYYLVVFEELAQPAQDLQVASLRDKRIKQLEAELNALREDMRSIVEAQEAANEELQSANEEIVSSNEELQSINEELETSKEEIESSNEELITINQELQVRNEQLAEVLEYSEAIFTTTRESLLLLDKDLHVKAANNAFYKTFRTREEVVVGKLVYELDNKQWDIPALHKLLDEIVPRSMYSEGFEITHTFTGVGKKVLLVNARKVVQKIHHQQLILLAIEDITEQRILNQELEKHVEQRTHALLEANLDLERTNGELEQFAYVASHDLQEPLRKILTFINRMQRGHEDDFSQESKKYFNKINDASNRMIRLIDDLLNFSRIARLGKRYVKTDLNSLLQSILVDLDLLITDKRATVTIDKLPVIHAIPLQMTQLFYNLLTNALKFIVPDRGAVIHISSKLMTKEEKAVQMPPGDAEAYYDITVRDNGIGFRQEYAEQIFTIFQRLHDNSQYSGTGIGLSLCRKIVTNHNGKIFAEGRENEGATFHILLPAKQENAIV
ncbi:MAG TPA: CheR family methyltransferase [Chitinophaga sp.]